jgi:hypothetical protein
MMLRAGILPALLGAVVGIPVSLAATRSLGSVMNGARAQDPWLLCAVAVLLVMVSLGAGLLPACPACGAAERGAGSACGLIDGRNHARFSLAVGRVCGRVRVIFTGAWTKLRSVPHIKTRCCIVNMIYVCVNKNSYGYIKR